MPPRKASQLSPRIIANRRNGALGGKARAKNNSQTKIKEWGAKGGNSTLALYGIDFFRHARKKAKTAGKYRTPLKTK